MTKTKNEKEEFIRVGTTLYKLVNQPRLNGGYVRKRIVWNNETLRQDYGKDYLATVPKYDGFCTVPNHVDYRPVVDKFLNLYEPIEHCPQQGEFPCIQSATALPATRTKTAHPAVGIGRTQYGQEHVPELSESPLSEQCHVQHQRGLPQPVQFRLGRKTPYRGG